MEPECFANLGSWIEDTLGRPLDDNERAALSPISNAIWTEGKQSAWSDIRQAVERAAWRPK